MALQYNYSRQVQSGGDKSSLDSILQNEFVLLGITRSGGEPITLDANALRKDSIEAIVASKVKSMMNDQDPINWLQSQLGNAGITTTVGSGSILTKMTALDVYDSNGSGSITLNSSGQISGKTIKASENVSAPTIKVDDATLTKSGTTIVAGGSANSMKASHIIGSSDVSAPKIASNSLNYLDGTGLHIYDSYIKNASSGVLMVSGPSTSYPGGIKAYEVYVDDILMKKSGTYIQVGSSGIDVQNMKVHNVIYFGSGSANLGLNSNNYLALYSAPGIYASSFSGGSFSGSTLTLTSGANIGGKIDCANQIDAASGFYEQ